jgi:hypothetical protein
MVDEDKHVVYVAEVDAEVLSAAIRRRQIAVLALIPVLFAVMGLVVWVRTLDGSPLPLSALVRGSLLTIALLVVVAYLAVPRYIKKAGVDVGGDFLVAPLVRSPRHRAVVRYGEVVAVTLRTATEQILGATIWTKTVSVYTGRIKNPGLVVRAIFERAPESVKWRRSSWPLRKLSRAQVGMIIEAARIPGLDTLLPPSTRYALADEVFRGDQPEEVSPTERGSLKRFWGGGTGKVTTIMSPEVPTPASRYVHAMLFQMFERGPKTRMLWRSQSLPTLTLGAETVETPPLEDVLDRLKFMCRLDPRTCRTPPEGTIHITFKGKGSPAEEPHQVLCQFDDKSDPCCQIRLERLTK